MSEIPYWNIIDKILFMIISVHLFMIISLHLFQSSKCQNFQILWFPYSNTYIDIRRECAKGILRMMIITTMIIIIITVFRGVIMFVPCQETCQIIVFLRANLQVVQDASKEKKLCGDLEEISRKQDDWFQNVHSLKISEH
jgi:hypothetical protein